jgi:hypothetical protein
MHIEGGQRMHKMISKKERSIVVSTDRQAVYETRDQEIDPGEGHFLQELVEEVTAQPGHATVDGHSVTEQVYGYKGSGNLMCPNCQKTFTKHSNIKKKHIGPVHAKKMFYCNDCSESFARRDQLKTHLARHVEATGSGGRIRRAGQAGRGEEEQA